jgi:hypothetical protein
MTFLSTKKETGAQVAAGNENSSVIPVQPKDTPIDDDLPF